MLDRLDQVFLLVEEGLSIACSGKQAQQQQQQQQQINLERRRCNGNAPAETRTTTIAVEAALKAAITTAEKNRLDKQLEQTPAAASEPKTTGNVHDWLDSTYSVEEGLVVTPTTSGRRTWTSRQARGTVKSIRSPEPARPVAAASSSSSGRAGAAEPAAFRKPAKGSQPLLEAANEIDWNEDVDVDDEIDSNGCNSIAGKGNDSSSSSVPPLKTVYARQSTVVARQSTSGTTAAASRIESEITNNHHRDHQLSTDVYQDDVNSDTPCPSGCNSREASPASSRSAGNSSNDSDNGSSSSNISTGSNSSIKNNSECSSSSWRCHRQQQQLIAFDELIGGVGGGRRRPYDSESLMASTTTSSSTGHRQQQQRARATSTICLIDGTSITANVSFVQQAASVTAPTTTNSTPAGDQADADIQCRLVSHHLMPPTDT